LDVSLETLLNVSYFTGTVEFLRKGQFFSPIIQHILHDLRGLVDNIFLKIPHQFVLEM
jgi:hypothetical protein